MDEQGYQPLKFRSALWLTLFVGSFQRCWAWDPQDKCQGLLANTSLGSATLGILTGYLDCIRQESTCQDAPVPCNELECKAEADLTEWISRLYGVSSWPDSKAHTRMLLVSGTCPLTCKLCGPRKGDRQVTPLVATIRRGPCKLGWSYADSACFKYFYVGPDGWSSHRIDWFSAENACQAEGAHLATVRTKAQEHLVFDLVGQHPTYLGRAGLWAWIGLWTQCFHNSSNWRWIGAPQLNITSSPLHSLLPAVCPPWSTGSQRGVFTHSNIFGKSFGVESGGTHRELAAWVCSKPAMFHPVTRGQCQDVGLAPIHDLEACKEAFKVLMGMDAPAIRIETTTRPFGCQMMKAGIGPELNTEPGAHIVSADPRMVLLCQSTNGTNQTAVDPEIGLSGQWEGVRASEVPPSFSQPLLVSLLAASFLPVLVVLAARRQDLIALARYLLLTVSRFITLHVSKSVPGATDPFIMVAARLQQKRRTVASVAAVAVAAFHLFELVRVCLVEESVCMSATAHPQLRLFLALVHLGSLWVAGAFLALTHRIGQHSSRPDLAFLLAVTVLDVIQTVLVGEQALLVESRLYSQFLWRLLLGASASPGIVLMGSLLHLIGVSAAYKALIPDGFIFTVGSTRAGLLYHQGCNQLWSHADALTGKDLLLDMSRLSGVTDVSAMQNLKALLDELLKKQTSFNDFLLSEISLAAIVMGCLVFLNTIMSKEISKSLRLQASEDQLLAMSQVMDNLCDATCQLSCDFQVCCHARKLNLILHMSPSGPSTLEGTNFCDIIDGEDERAGFQAFVQRGIRDGFRNPYYLNLKGASGMLVRMQMLCAHFFDALGHARVLCGFTELQAGGRDATETGIADTFGPLVPRQAEPRRTRHRSHRATSSSRSASSSSGGSGGSSVPRQAIPRRTRHRSHRATSSSRSASSGSGGSSGSISGLDSGSHQKRRSVEIRLNDNLTVVKTNRAFMEFLGILGDDSCSANLKPFLGEPEVSVERLRSCAEGVGSDEFGAPSAQVIDIIFNTRSQDGGFTPRQAACRVTPRQSSDSPSGATLKLELLKVGRRRGSSLQPSAASGHGGEELGPCSLGRSLADRCSM